MKPALTHSVPGLIDFLRVLQGKPVVIDTARTLVYLGTLSQVTETGLLLENADVHDSGEGHATKESYIYESKIEGIRTNRRRVFVLRDAIMSVSALADVIQEDMDMRDLEKSL